MLFFLGLRDVTGRDFLRDSPVTRQASDNGQDMNWSSNCLTAREVQTEEPLAEPPLPGGADDNPQRGPAREKMTELSFSPSAKGGLSPVFVSGRAWER